MNTDRGRKNRPRGAALMMLTSVALTAGACGPRRPELVRLPKDPPPAVLIRNAAVLDVESGKLSERRDVLIVGDRIAKIGAAGAVEAPAGAGTIEAEGATLLPGLIDMHAHIGNAPEPSWVTTIPDPAANLRAYLYCGVTTVLDPADLSTQAVSRRDSVARGELLGPAIYTAGPMVTAPGGHPIAMLDQLVPWWFRWYLTPRAAIAVDSPAEADAAAATLADLRVDVLKLAVDRIPEEAPRIKREVLDAAVAAAKKRGLRAVAHIGSVEDARDAGNAGVSAWMHGVYKERIADDAIRELAGFGIPMVPTMVVFESYALLGQGPRAATPLERETVPPSVLESLERVPKDDPAIRFFAGFLETLRGQRQNWRDNVRRLHAAGVTIFAGSDSQMGVFPGASLHRELRLLAESGFTPAEAIRAATVDPARFLANGKQSDFGIVAEGKRADLLLVEGDPSESLDALERIRIVMKGGVVLERLPVSRPTS
ncbi:MAG: amidohydrolase family protein [Candidatus Binatia bacterium]